ncbi:hypothetical protein AMQ83_01860 [Paenibacillus riograndensis]|nr:hypothetical protein AMQ83_01860 [Paenibacillus riograndensis]
MCCRGVEKWKYYEDKRTNGGPEAAIRAGIHKKSRDNARTPMQWDDGENGGFTTGVPWIRVNSNSREINAASAVRDPDSIYHYYKKLIELRKKHQVIVYGDYTLLLEEHPEIYAYTRTLEEERLLVILNFFEREPVFELPEDFQPDKLELLISNYTPDKGEDLKSLKLRPYEARVYLQLQSQIR